MLRFVAPVLILQINYENLKYDLGILNYYNFYVVVVVVFVFG